MNTTPSPNLILLVGAGNMATEYAKILKALKKPLVVVGRSEKSAANFEQVTGMSVVRGGLKIWFKKNAGPAPSTAIVAVDEEQLGLTTRLLISRGIKTILLEKPGGLNVADLKKTQKLAKEKECKIFIAYNRRFYASTLKAQEYIKKDGGVTSFNFDFTERSDRIETAPFSAKVKKEWLLANSSHVIDLAFFLGGKPEKINSRIAGSLNWHPRASIYVGAGISISKALFSYHANWESAGRWSVEIMTPKRKLIFRPLEKLQMQKMGSMVVEEVRIDDKLDAKFKSGLYRLTQSFLTTQKDLPTVDEQMENLRYYELINGR